MSAALKKFAGPATSLALLAGAGYLLERSLRDLRIRDLWHALNEFPAAAILTAFGLTAVSYLALSVYDYIGVRYIKARIGYPRVALAAFCAYSISHSLGCPAVTGGAVRYRLYSRWGFGAVEVAQIMGMAGITLFLGMLSIAGVALLLDGDRVQQWTDLPSVGINALGVACVSLVAFYGTIGFFRREPFRLLGCSLTVPSPGFAALQILVSGVDWFMMAAVLYVLLPPNPLFSFPTFLGVFVLAFLFGTLSNVPGGLGVFDSIILIAMRNAAPPEALLSSLLVYRLVYHLLPLALGGTVYLGLELRRNRTESLATAPLPRLQPRQRLRAKSQ